MYNIYIYVSSQTLHMWIINICYMHENISEKKLPKYKPPSTFDTINVNANKIFARSAGN